LKTQREIFTGVEIGTSSIKVLLAEFLPGDSLSVLALGEAPSLKMCKGEAIDTRVVGGQVALALAAAEQAAGFPIPGPVYMAIYGAFLETINITGSVAINEPGGLIQESNLEEATRQSNLPEVPQGKFRLAQSVNRLFRLADGRVLFNPIGQCSRSLEVETQHFIADWERANTSYCLLSEALGKLAVDTVIYTPLAVSSGVFPPALSDEALNLVIDIGGGMTSMAMPTSVGHFHLGQVSIGCEHLANDLSIALDLPIQTARSLICQLDALHCTAVATKDNRARMVTIHQDTMSKHRVIPASSIELVIEMRLRELFELIRRLLDERGAYSWLGNRVFLSGGGARIPRITDLAATVFNRPVSVAQPYRVTGRADFQQLPQYNTVIGLIRAGYRDLQVARQVSEQASPVGTTVEWWKNAWKAITDW